MVAVGMEAVIGTVHRVDTKSDFACDFFVWGLCYSLDYCTVSRFACIRYTYDNNLTSHSAYFFAPDEIKLA
jgi:hypothetical protein